MQFIWSGRCAMVRVKSVSNLFKKCWITFKRYHSTEGPTFPGAKTTWTDRLEFINVDTYQPIPVYRILDRKGQIIDAQQEPKLEPAFLQRMYRSMTLLSAIDSILYDAQRQGRISFYMTNYGEEATHIGSAAALDLADVIYGQYREAGVLVWRGFTPQNFVDQCYGNIDDTGRGKQMPVHYGSRKLNFVTISSPLATQMPQAVGAAYALKGQGRVVVCYFGDGAASEGDAHAALNFAATLECPVLMFCRNNGYAISTPVRHQYRGDGIAARGPAFGIATLRVDGNDVLAVYEATKLARDYALQHSKPVLIEALCYRVSHHSTSDDSTAYRAADEVIHWTKNDNPITKFKSYLISKKCWSEEEDKQWTEEARNTVLSAFKNGEKKLKPTWTEMFVDVYKDMPKHIKEQMDQLKTHLDEYAEHYPLEKYVK